MSGTDTSKRADFARQVIIDIAVLAAIGVVLALLAPLGTGYMPFARRLAYWVVLALAGYLFYKPIGALVLRLAPRLALPEWFLWSISVAIATVPMALLVWLVNEGAARVPTLEIALAHYFGVLVVGAVVTLTFNLLPATRSAPPPREAQDETSPVPPENPPPVRFLDRLPPELGSELLALEMEDHYVRAHTALGSDLVLLRMRDAVAELDGVEGLQVHRSWWVARCAVEKVLRDGRNVRLRLPRGIEAPVSRTNVSLLKERGWI